MNLRLISPKENFIKQIADLLPGVDKDYSRYWVIFPDQRPAYYLRKYLAQREQSSYIPPQIDSIDNFIRHVYEQYLHKSLPLIDSINAVAVLFDIHQKAPNRIGSNHFLSADSFFPLGIKLFNDLEELNLAETRVDEIRALDRLAEETIPVESQARMQSLSYFYEQFYEEIETRGYSTHSSRFREVLNALNQDLFPEIKGFIFAGFFSLTKTEKCLMKEMMQWENTTSLFLKGPGIHEVLENLGVPVSDFDTQLAVNEENPPLEFYQSPDTHGQIFALNKILETKYQNPFLFNEKQVIVLPSAETLFPLYQQGLSQLSDQQYNISMGYPLSRTPIYSFFDQLLELVQSMDEEGRIYVPNYLRFILHPYTKNIYFKTPTAQRADLTRILFHTIEEELTHRRTKAFWTLEELESDTNILESLRNKIKNLENAPTTMEMIQHLKMIHANTVGRFKKIINVGDFAGKLRHVLNFIYDNSTARLHYFFHPYAESFMEQLTSLQDSLLEDMVFRDFNSYFNLLRKIVSAGSVPFHGTPLRGLQVLGFWETRCIPFEEVYLLDVNEDVLPSYHREDSLMPFAVRKELELPTYQEHEKRMEYYLDTLIKGATKVHLFFVANNDKQRSRYIEKLIWEVQKKDHETKTDKYIHTIQYSVELQATPPVPIHKTPEVVEFLKSFTYSATALDTYLQCPLQFYYQYVLNLREKEEISEQMEKMDIGIFVHQILENYFRPYLGKALQPGQLDLNELDRLIEHQYQANYGKEISGSAYLIKLQTQRHLRDFINRYQEPLILNLNQQGLALQLDSLEQTIDTTLDVDGNTLKLRAKIDRMEYRGNKLYILDYKSGANEKNYSLNFSKLEIDNPDTWSNAVNSIQLPFYHLVCTRKLQLPPEKVRCRLLMLGKSIISPEIEYSVYNKEAAVDQDLVDLSNQLIENMLSQLMSPSTSFAPCPQTGTTCSQCPFVYICNRNQ